MATVTPELEQVPSPSPSPSTSETVQVPEPSPAPAPASPAETDPILFVLLLTACCVLVFAAGITVVRSLW